jgi:hypothetical protein
VNPALPLLLALSLGGLALRRVEGGRAVLVSGLAAMLLLAAALAMPNGIPGPASDLARRAPWAGAAPAAPGNPALQDVTYQVYPWLLHLRHELREGRWPFWNPHQFSGMTFWGNGQSAPLSPLHLLFVLLPLQLGFFVVPWCRIVLAACGVYALARELDLAPSAASVAALIFPLSGMFVSFLLFPMGSALALVPWVFWAVERIASGRGSWPALGFIAGVQMLSGHPETCLHTALLSVFYLAVRADSPRRLQSWRRLTAGWLVAALVGMVVLLPLAHTVLASSRWQQAAELRGQEPSLRTLLPLPLRLVLPDLFGNPARGTWWGPFNYLATAVYAGILALPLAVLGGAGWKGDRRRLAWIGVLVFSAAAAYHLPGLRQAIEWLPLVGRALHHRLLFGVELGLAMLSGFGVQAWLAGRGRPAAWGVVAAVAALGTGFGLYRQQWLAHGLAAQQMRWALWAGLLLLLFLASLRLSPMRRARAVPLLLVLVGLDLVAAHRAINPASRLGDLYPPTGALEFLRGHPGRIAAVDDALRPNAAMVYGLDDIRGDDSLKPRRYEDVLAALGEHHAAYFAPLRRWDSPWLDRLAVRWVITAPHVAAAEPGWTLAYEGADARVFERPGAAPIVRWAGGGAQGLRVAVRSPGLWGVEYAAAQPARIVVAEGWDRGWRAAIDGRRAPIASVDGVLLGVDVPPGEGTLVLRYTPAGLVAGAAASLGGCLVLLLGWRRGW